jgi:hypothetical protein
MNVTLFIAAVLSVLVGAGARPADTVLGGPASLVSSTSSATANNVLGGPPSAPATADNVLGGPPSK